MVGLFVYIGIILIVLLFAGSLLMGALKRIKTGRNIVLVSFLIGSVLVVSGCTGASIASDHAAQAGKLLWQHTYGGPGVNSDPSVIRTSDGGYAIAGSTIILADNVTTFYNTSRIYLVKTDSNGAEVWNRTYRSGIYASSVVQTADGGYAIAGQTYRDPVLLKTDASGNEQWNTSLIFNTSHSNSVMINSLVLTKDGNYIVMGNLVGSLLVAEIGANGKTIWSKTYESYNGRSLIITSDGGYVVVGNGVGSEFKPFLIKIDKDGNQMWNKSYMPSFIAASNTSTNMCIGYAVIQTSDGGYALTGTSSSISTNISSNVTTVSINSNVMLVKTDVNGDEVWNRTYEGSGDNEGMAMVQNDDGSYTIACVENPSFTSVSSSDILSNETQLFNQLLQYHLYLIGADSTGKEIWKNDYGLIGNGRVLSLIRSGDGGYIVSGLINSSDNLVERKIFLEKIA